MFCFLVYLHEKLNAHIIIIDPQDDVCKIGEVSAKLLKLQKMDYSRNLPL